MTFRLTVRQRVSQVGWLLPLVLFQLVLYGEGWNLVGGAGSFAVLVTVVVLATAGMGATLTERGLSVDGLRRRFLPWPQVSDIRTEKLLGTRYLVVVHGFERIRLRAPVTGPLQRDPQFEAKVAEIREWWLVHGGAERQVAVGPPLPRPRPPQALTSTSASAFQAATGVIALVAAAVVALVTWFPRSETTFGFLIVEGGRLPGTQWYLAGATVLGIAAGAVLARHVARRRPASVDPVVTMVPVRHGVVPFVVAGVALTTVVGLSSWVRWEPLMLPLAYVAAMLAVAVVCLGTLPWLRRLEREGPVPIHTARPFWVPPALRRRD